MPTRRESAWHFDDTVLQPPAVAHSETRPDSAMRALMECPPGVEPQRSLEELAPIREILVDAMDSALSDRERFVIEGLFYRRISQWKLAEEMSMSRSNVRRIREVAKRKLQRALLAHNEIQEYLGVDGE